MSISLVGLRNGTAHDAIKHGESAVAKPQVSMVALDAVHSTIYTDEAICSELAEHLTFEAPGARFNPLCKRRRNPKTGAWEQRWDGKIRLFNKRQRRAYTGLAGAIYEFCRIRGYAFENIAPRGFKVHTEAFLSLVDVVELPAQFVVRDYQEQAIRDAFEERRALFVSPTASGKSLIIYLLTRGLTPINRGPLLIIVPTSALVHQLTEDFKDYGYDVDQYVHKITGGEKWTNKPVTISTWQSAVKQDDAWFEQFKSVIGDEAHLFKAKSLVSIMERLINATWRFGFTGTLDGSKTNKMVLEGLFGPVRQVARTKDLITKGYLSKVCFTILKLEHPPRARGKRDYFEEIDFLVECEARNKLIVNLVNGLKGNTLILFSRIEAHGDILQRMLKEKLVDRPLYYVHGGIDGEERDEVRQQVMNDTNAVVLASYGVFSTGVNVPRIHNLVMASPWKSRILNLQSIGRLLRVADGKEQAHVYDIGDDLSVEGWMNHTLKHMNERIRIYCEEELDDYRLIPLDLEY